MAGAVVPDVGEVAAYPGRVHSWQLVGGPALPVLSGLLGSLALMALYIALVTLAQGFEHLLQLLSEDWYLVGPIVLAFGVQTGLYVRLRQKLRERRNNRPATAVAGLGTGTSTVAMVACCAHHATDLLPLLGLSGATLFLADYRHPLMLAGIATSLVGIAIMVRRLRGL